MTIVLSPQEKIAIAEQHMKNVLYSEYNVSLSLSEANSASKPNADNIASLNAQAADIAAQKSLLQAEIDAQNALIASESQTSN